MTSPVLRTAALDSFPGSVDALKGRRQAPVCSRERGAGLTERAQATTRVPDVPLALDLLGGSKGLVQNSESLCGPPKRAAVAMAGQNGKTFNGSVPQQVSCRSNGKRGRHHGKSPANTNRAPRQ